MRTGTAGGRASGVLRGTMRRRRKALVTALVACETAPAKIVLCTADFLRLRGWGWGGPSPPHRSLRTAERSGPRGRVTNVDNTLIYR